jgi:hypothetical protein
MMVLGQWLSLKACNTVMKIVRDCDLCFFYKDHINSLTNGWRIWQET